MDPLKVPIVRLAISTALSRMADQLKNAIGPNTVTGVLLACEAALSDGSIEDLGHVVCEYAKRRLAVAELELARKTAFGDN